MNPCAGLANQKRAYPNDISQLVQSTSVHFFPSASYVKIEYHVDWAALCLPLSGVGRVHNLRGTGQSERVWDLAVEVTTNCAVQLCCTSGRHLEACIKVRHSGTKANCVYFCCAVRTQNHFHCLYYLAFLSYLMPEHVQNYCFY